MRTRACAAAAAFLLALAAGAHAAPAPAEVGAVVHADRAGAVIDRDIYGQFAEHLGRGIYEGVWVGEGSPIPNIRGYRKDVVEALKAIHVPVIRWPGGCFADEYDWRDGVGPREKRPVRVNTNWGGVEDSNAFGTHEFMDFAELVGAQAYVNGDIGTGSPREMAQWLEYMTSDSNSSLARERRANGRAKPWKVDFMAIGNEPWGCGGNMRPEYYADLYRRYATFLKAPPERPVRKVASGANAGDYKFTETLMAQAGDMIDAYAIHFYTVPSPDWDHKGSATRFGEAEWIATLKRTLRMEELITKHSAVMDRYDPGKRIALFVDEWGAWHDVEPGTNPGFLFQQNSLRDALTAAINLNIFHRHADRVRMTNIAQMVNVLQAMILTDRDRMVLTPTYHVYDMYQAFQGATDLPLDLEAPDYRFGDVTVPAVSGSAARDGAGVFHIALVNLDPHAPATVRARIEGASPRAVSGRVLTAPQMSAFNSFDQPQRVRPAAFAGARLAGGALTATLPPKSVVVLDLR